MLLESLGPKQLGTHFTCFTGTKVQILTQPGNASGRTRPWRRCFTHALLMLCLCFAYALLMLCLFFTYAFMYVFVEGVRDPGAAVTALVATAMIRVLHLRALLVQKCQY